MSYFGSTEWYQKVAEGQVADYSIKHIRGRNKNAGTTFVPIISNTVASLWTPTAATKIRVKSGGNANDTSAGTGVSKISVEGLNGSFAEISETITLAGASASSSTTATFIRVNEAFSTECGTYRGGNAGNVRLETNTGTNIATIETGEGRTQHGFYCAPTSRDVWLIYANVISDSTDDSSIRIFTAGNVNDVTTRFTCPKRMVMQVDRIDREWDYEFVSPLKLTDGVSSPIEIWSEGRVASGTGFISVNLTLLIKDIS